ncbi:rhamnulokinase family protein [Candidatus Hydrogenedentota bacterium]
MSKSLNYLAVDLGAESGRTVLGRISDGKLELEEVNRFPNGPVNITGNAHWNIVGLYSEIMAGMARSASLTDGRLDGIGIDTWGVDFGLLDKNGLLLGIPFHYRDSRTNGIMERVFGVVSRREVFETTGIQFMQFNTLFQLFAMAAANSPALAVADRFLMIPDLLNYFLTGEKVGEFSNATTTQAYDPRKGEWASDMLDKLGVPASMMPDLVQPGTVIGELSAAVAEETGLEGMPVIAPATHDTGSAVAAVPFGKGKGAFLSSGTWSLIGAEVAGPVINEKALEYNFTNEGGVCDTFRLLKNIMGLWLLQQSRKVWQKEDGAEISYADIALMSESAVPFVTIFDVDDPTFLAPDNMPAAIRAHCEKVGEKVPADRSAMTRTIFESLALKYRKRLAELEGLSGEKYDAIHVVGGGSQNQLLCQMTADATGLPVVAGPVEATAIGNILMQAIGTGEISSIAEGREIVLNSFPVKTYEPNHSDAWDAACERLENGSA